MAISENMKKALESITDDDRSKIWEELEREHYEYVESAGQVFEITAITPEKRESKRVLAWQLIEGKPLPPGVWQAHDGTYLHTYMFGTFGIAPGCWVVEIAGSGQCVYDDEHFQELMKDKSLTREHWDC